MVGRVFGEKIRASEKEIEKTEVLDLQLKQLNLTTVGPFCVRCSGLGYAIYRTSCLMLGSSLVEIQPEIWRFHSLRWK